MPLIKGTASPRSLDVRERTTQQLPPEGAIIVTLARWQANRDQLGGAARRRSASA